MSTEKIRITLDDVHSSTVDAKLQQQAALTRSQAHYQQLPPIPNVTSAFSRGSLWYHPVFYMALFGLVGGICAWGTSEIAERLAPPYVEQFRVFANAHDGILELVQRGHWTRAEGNRAMDALFEQYRGNPYVEIFRDPLLNETQKLAKAEQLASADLKKQLLSRVLFFGVIGLVLSCFLAIADSIVSRNWRGVMVNSSLGLLLGLVGGVSVGLFINQLYNWLGGGVGKDMFHQVLARGIGWAVLGLFLAVAPGILLRSWKRLAIGLAGGFLGGLVGGLLFDSVSMVSGSAVLSRGLAIVAIGVVAGAATGLIENAAKSGWLRITAGLIVGKQFILYRNPTVLGSSPQCDIYLFKDPQIAPQHAAVHVIQGRFELEDLRSSTGTAVNGRLVSRCRLQNGDTIQIGSTVCQFQEKAAGNMP